MGSFLIRYEDTSSVKSVTLLAETADKLEKLFEVAQGKTDGITVMRSTLIDTFIHPSDFQICSDFFKKAAEVLDGQRQDSIT